MDEGRYDLLIMAGEYTAEVYFNGNYAGETSFTVEPGEARRLLLGRPPAEAADLLERRFDLARPPHILLWPSWLPRLPLLPVRIDIHWSWESG